MKTVSEKTHSILFLVLLILVFIVSTIGWINDSIYSNNTAELQIKSRFYDLSILIFAIPFSLITLLFLFRDYTKARILTLGITVYILFSYSVIIFTINQNKLFLIYIAIVSSGAFYFTNEFYSFNDSNIVQLPKGLIKWVALTLLFSAVSGFGYWIVDSLIFLTTQQNEFVNLPVKAPQVFDMALALPFTIYGAIKLWKGEKNGTLISLIMMIFFILIGLSVISMELGLSKKANVEFDFGKVISYSVISLLNLIMTIIAYRKFTTN